MRKVTSGEAHIDDSAVPLSEARTPFKYLLSKTISIYNEAWTRLRTTLPLRARLGGGLNKESSPTIQSQGSTTQSAESSDLEDSEALAVMLQAEAVVHRASEDFVYRPLDPGREIRLIKLDAALPYAPITVHLYHASLDDPDTRYEALSYTWGNHSNKVSIVVNGKEFRVTQNLNTALRYLRKRNKDMVIWIDALCINQNNDEEKGQQVALMPEIYRLADQVKIWLGPAADDSNLAMETFEEEGKKLGKEGYLQSLHARLMCTTQNRLRRSLEALMQREYWTRVWVVQEIVMARGITIICGKLSTSWEYVTLIVKEFEVARNVASITSYAKLSLGVSFQTMAIDDRKLNTIQSLSSYRHSTPEERGPDWLLRALLGLRHFKSTDPKDKIFSILGLLNHDFFKDSNSGLHVDYSLSFEEVSLRLFKHLLLSSRQKSGSNRWWEQPEGRLNILCASQPNRDSNFPSWLPDFSKDNGMRPWPTRGEEPPKFPLDSENVSSDGRTLFVHARELSTIQEGCVTGNEDDCQATDDLSMLSRIRRFLLLALKRIGPEVFDDFWPLLVLGSITSDYLKNDFHTMRGRPFVFETSKVPKILEFLERRLNERTSNIFHAFIQDFRLRSYRRRFAVFHVAGQKFMAMVPEAATEGDRLYQLDDCNYLVLLRPRHPGTTSFEFVGPCYVSGLRVDDLKGKCNSQPGEGFETISLW